MPTLAKPAASIAALSQTAAKYATAARADNTVSAYSKQYRYFAEWCAQNGLAAMPAAPETVALYLSAQAERGLKVASLKLALAAISQMHELGGHSSPRSHSLVREVLKGVARTHGAAQTQAAPVLVADLREMVKDASPRDRALVLLGWAGAFRRSELVGLMVADVAFVPQGLVVTLRRSKTDKFGHGRQVAIPRAADAALCPVAAVRAWLDRHPGDGHLFRSVDRYGNVGGPLDGKDVARVLKKLGGEQFSGHSLRAGYATTAAEAGMDAMAIAQQTGHRSPAMVQKYVRSAKLFGRPLV